MTNNKAFKGVTKRKKTGEIEITVKLASRCVQHTVGSDSFVRGEGPDDVLPPEGIYAAPAKIYEHHRDPDDVIICNVANRSAAFIPLPENSAIIHEQ